MVKLWSICKNTFVQTIRQPIYGILIVVTFAVLVITLPLTDWAMSTNYRESNQMMLESLGLSTLLVSGLLVAAFSASSVLSREIEDRTAMTVISKPVARATFVLGKFAGVQVAVALAFYLCSLVFLMTVRHRVMPSARDPMDYPVVVLGLAAFGLVILTALMGNYFFGWQFISSGVWSAVVLLSLAMGLVSFIGKKWQIVPFGHDTPERLIIHGQLLVGIVLIFMAVTIFVAVAVAVSTRLGQVMTLLICCAVFFLGSMHPYLFGDWAFFGLFGKEPLVARVIGWIVPKLTYFFPLDALTKKDIYIPASYVGWAAGYCGLYVAGLLAVGMALFERRQLEAQGSSATMPASVALLAWTGRAVAIAGGLIALALLSVPGVRNAKGFATVGAILAGAALIWMLWSAFGKGGRGGRWAYWLAAVIAAVALAMQLAAIGLPNVLGVSQLDSARVSMVAGAMVAALVILILILPKTRRHFRSSL